MSISDDEIYIYIYIYELVTVIEGIWTAPFSIATTLSGREECYSLPGLHHFVLDPRLVKQGGIKYLFKSLDDLTLD